MSIHRFLEFQPTGNARVALRADGSIWLIANPGGVFELNRGHGWVTALRQQLCRGDRVRIEGREMAAAELCAMVGVEEQPAQAGRREKMILKCSIPGVESPEPLFAPARVVDNARRNPGTGQVEAGREST